MSTYAALSSMLIRAWRWALDHAVLVTAIAIFLGVTWFRFYTARFVNDDFLHLSMAQQLLLGDLPIRDFLDPGRLLEYGVSAAVQAVTGSLLGEALLNVVAIGLGHAIAFLLARRLTNSTPVAASVVVGAALLQPRLYNYPKVLLYPLALLALWAWLEQRSRGRLFVLGAVCALAFLYRHDYGAYVGLTVAATVALAQRGQGTRVVIRDVATATGVALTIVAPFLLYVQLNGGLVSYLRNTVETGAAEARRTESGRPTFDLVWEGALPALATPEAPRINVRWAPQVDSAEREVVAREHGLTAGDFIGGTSWQYDLGDTSRGTIRSLVGHAAVEDTQGIDRNGFTVSTRVPRPNAVAWLFYLLWLVPAVAAALVALQWRGGAITTPELEQVLSVCMLCGLASLYLLRDSGEARLGDVAALVAVPTAWLVAQAGRAAAGWRARPVRAALAATASALILVPTAGALLQVEGGFELRRMLGTLTSGEIAGPTTVARLTVRQVRELSAVPPFRQELPAYLNACTRPEDRVVATWYAPEVYYRSGRGFGAGRVYFLRSLASSEEYQRFSIRRLESENVPVILERVGYWDDFESAFPMVAEWIREHYRPTAEARLDGEDLRIWIDAEREPSGRHSSTDLPCFR